MKKHIIAIVILLSMIFSFYSFKCNAEDWPAELCDRQVCLRAQEDPNLRDSQRFPGVISQSNDILKRLADAIP